MQNRTFSSRSIRLGARLLAASTGVAGMLVLQACDDRKTDAGIYPDAESCAADKVFSAEYCAKNFQTAREEHQTLAPVYQDKEDCEKDWSEGACDEKPVNQPSTSPHGGGGSTVIYSRTVYAPHMSGYWTGVTETPGENGAKPTTRNFSYPIYKSKDGTVYSPATEQTFSAYGRFTTNPDTAMVRTVTESPRAIFVSRSSFSSGAAATTGTATPGGPAISRGGFGATAHSFGLGIGD